MFATCLQSVWYTFVKCLQRVGYLYVTFSQNKRVVFALQKYGFWRAKRGFLHCKSMVFVFWMLCCCKSVARISWVNVDISQNICHIIPIRQQRCWQTVSSRRGPIYRARISVYIHKMTNRNVFAMKRICVFDDVKIRIWQCKDMGTINRSPTPNGVFVGNFVRRICDLLCPECT